ncbi:MAG: aminoglycoside phosphotransferase family protein [Bacteroidaceae bacterium]|nr:aminoglycoside phosphotransferase family protein [Bacteroidaceae bacterium]
MTDINPLLAVVAAFAVKGTPCQVQPLGNGLINDTFLVKTEENAQPDYVLQRINQHVFTDVALLQRNIEMVTQHLRHKYAARGVQDVGRRVLRFLYTRDGTTYHRDDDGNYWRMSVYIPRTQTLETVTPQSATSAGNAFGQFEADLVDLPAQPGETIPNFHNLCYRLQQLHEVVGSDPAGRVRDNADVRKMLDEIHSDSHDMTLAERMYAEGKLPKRICHCDTKVNNILFDEQGEVLCVVDLDTVMPSYIFSDYGDFLRSAVNTTAEDDGDMSHVGFRDDIFQAFTTGYLHSASSFLSPVEVEMLPYAVALFPYMQAVRFLWDHISGDHYWKCRYSDHNLDRARNQMQLYRIAKQKHDDMAAFIHKTLKQHTP